MEEVQVELDSNIPIPEEQQEQQEPVATPFDNEYSMLYKWASYYGQPAKYMLVNRNFSDDQPLREISFQPLIDRIIELADEGLNVVEIFDAVSNPDVYPFPDVRLERDVAMIYAGIFFDNRAALVDILNQYFQTISSDPNIIPYRIENEADLVDEYETWQLQFRDQLEADQQKLDLIIALQQELSSHEGLLMSDLRINTMVLAAHPRMVLGYDASGGRILGPAVTSTYGLEIFNISQLSDYVPFIQFNEQRGEIPKLGTLTGAARRTAARRGPEVRNLSKVYLGETQETAPNTNNIILGSGQSQGANVISMTIWTGTGRRATQASYTSTRYSLNNNRILITIPNTADRGIETVLERIEAALPIDLGPTEEVRVSGDFTLYNFQFNLPVLLDMILNQPLFNSYLYIDESAKSAAEKSRIHIHYRALIARRLEGNENRSPSSVTVTLTPGTTAVSETRNLLTENGVGSFDIPPNTPYVTVNIIKSDSRQVTDQFMQIFNRLLATYLDTEQETANVYSEYLGGDYSPVLVQPPPAPRVKPTDRYRSEDLNRAAPDLFVSGYPRKCQAGYQPAIIAQDEIEEWRGQTFEKTGVIYNRQVLPFPRNNPNLFLVCPNNTAPFPGVKRNVLPNQATYPYIPCCFDSDQMNPRAKSAYNEYYMGVARTATSAAKQRHKIITDKLLDPTRIGSLPVNVERLLQYSPDDPTLPVRSEQGFSRYGVTRSPNSLLHAVLVATDDREYLGLLEEEREAYVRGIRQGLASYPPSLVKQELYDLTDDEIVGRLLDFESFLDPALYYRYLEEEFGVNIYTFIPPPREPPNEPGALELPRHRLFHVRPLRPERPTVLILKHMGAESDALRYPQCELIIDLRGTGRRDEVLVRLYPTEVENYLHNAMYEMYQTYSWTPTGGSLVARRNPYSQIDFTRWLRDSGAQLLSQVVDSYGKLRGCNFTLSGVQATLVFPPSQPINLPGVSEPFRATHGEIIRIFGQPSSIATLTRSNGDIVATGLWYPTLDWEDGLFLPIVPTAELSEYRVGPGDPIFTEGTSSIQRLRKLQRDVNILLQLMQWFYELSGIGVEEFLREFTILGEDFDTAVVYDFSMLSRQLPNLTEYREEVTRALEVRSGEVVDQGVNVRPEILVLGEALQQIGETTQGLVREGKIYITGEDLLNGIRYFLQLYQKIGKKELQQQLTGMFEFETDFVQQSRVALFLSEADLRSWLRSTVRERFHSYEIRDRLRIRYGLQEEPYLHITPESYIYQIQNTSRRGLGQALEIARQWQVFGRNPGYEAQSYEGEIPPHVIYGISTSETLLLLADNRGDEMENFTQLLTYGGDQYAALLPLL